MFRLFSRFLKNTEGQFVVTLAMTLVPLLAAGGMSVDYHRSVLLQSDLQSALDAGLPYLHERKELTDDQARAFLVAYTNEKMAELHGSTHFHVSKLIRSSNGIEARIEGPLETTVMGIVGVSELTVSAEARAMIDAGELKTIHIVR